MPAREPERTALTAVIAIGVVTAAIVAIATRNVVLGLLVGAPFIMITLGLARIRPDDGSNRPRHS